MIEPAASRRGPSGVGSGRRLPAAGSTPADESTRACSLVDGKRRRVAGLAVAVWPRRCRSTCSCGRVHPQRRDEAEFEARHGPKGRVLAARTLQRAVEKESRTRGVRVLLTSAGGGFLGGVNQGRAYVRIAPNEERILSPGRMVSELFRPAVGPFRAILPAGGSRRSGAPPEVSDLRPRCATPVLNIGGGTSTSTSCRGRTSSRCPVRGTAARAASKLGILDADPTLKLNKPELRVVIDRARAADLDVDTEEISEPCPDGRRRRRGLPLRDPAVTTTRRGAAA